MNETDYTIETRLSGTLIGWGSLEVVPLAQSDINSLNFDDLVWDDLNGEMVKAGEICYEDGRFYIAKEED